VPQRRRVPRRHVSALQRRRAPAQRRRLRRGGELRRPRRRHRHVRGHGPLQQRQRPQRVPVSPVSHPEQLRPLRHGRAGRPVEDSDERPDSARMRSRAHVLRDDARDAHAQHEGPVIAMTRRLANAAERGFALTTSLIIVAIVGALIAGTVFTTQFETNVALNDAAAAQAQYVAQAGLQKYKAVLFQAFRYNESFGSGGALKCENSLSVGIDIFRDGAIYYWNNDRIALDPEPVLDVA